MKIGRPWMEFTTLPPFYASSSSMIVARIRPSSQLHSLSGGSVKFSSGCQFIEWNTDALMRRGADGCHWWNSSTISFAFLTFSSSSQLVSLYPFQSTRYHNTFFRFLPLPRSTHLLSRIPATSHSRSPSTSMASGGGGRSPLISLPFQGLSLSTWKTGCSLDKSGKS